MVNGVGKKCWCGRGHLDIFQKIVEGSGSLCGEELGGEPGCSQYRVQVGLAPGDMKLPLIYYQVTCWHNMLSSCMRGQEQCLGVGGE